mmetsp:Transcript_57316/g.184167  ORF Transcript_57316/g.184167 Transcript_57316/m.184167 type:complete len:164 (+) Transcript_57316:2-493(+)
MRNLPLLSLPKPWGLVADADGIFPVGAFEPRYLQLARKIGAPRGTLLYGYTETCQLRKGGLGVLVKVEQIQWLGQESHGQEGVHLTGRGVQPFRVLAIKPMEVAGGWPLYSAHVQLLPIDLAEASMAQQGHHGVMGMSMKQRQRVWESGMLGSGASNATQTSW